MTAQTAGSDVKAAGRRASHSRAFQILVRAGLATRGVMYMLVGSIAVQIAFGKTGQEADRRGALQTVAKTPGGTVMLWLIVIGFAGLALWRYAEAAFGQPGPDGDKATKRLASLGRGVFYTVACVSVISFLAGKGAKSSNDQSKSFTAKLMEHTGGRWLVLLIGLGFLAWGVGNIVNAIRKKFMKRLKTYEMDPEVRKIVEWLGRIGRSSRGVLFGGVGIFLAYAAIKFDPNKAKGLDGTLREFAKTPAGPWLLIVIALGLVIYGVYSFCEARWRRVEPG